MKRLVLQFTVHYRPGEVIIQQTHCPVSVKSDRPQWKQLLVKKNWPACLLMTDIRQLYGAKCILSYEQQGMPSNRPKAINHFWCLFDAIFVVWLFFSF
jgi:hypothetical protein